MKKYTQRVSCYGILFNVFHVEGSRTVVVKPCYEQTSIGQLTYVDLKGVIGKSVCAKEDKFSYERGLELALFRVLCQINGIVKTKLKSIQNDVNSFSAFVEKRKEIKK